MGHRFGKALGLGVCLVLKPYIWYRWGKHIDSIFMAFITRTLDLGWDAEGMFMKYLERL